MSIVLTKNDKPAPCDMGCRHRATCATGKACERFAVYSGMVRPPSGHVTTRDPNESWYRRVFGDA